MDWTILTGALAIFTLVAAIAIAVWSKQKTLERKRDPNAPKSSLAKDGPGPQPFR